jgi:hypothetical protein
MRVVPLTQPERDNPLMRPYFLEIGLSALRLARRCGVSHSQIYMARKRNVGAGNAEKIARGTASTLGLSERERLELKAEIMGHSGDLVRAYLGSQADAMKILGVREHTASELVSEEKSVNHASGTQALRKLRKIVREIGAPDVVVESVDRRLMRPERGPGTRTHDLRGRELAERKRRSKERLREERLRVYEALRGTTEDRLRAQRHQGKHRYGQRGRSQSPLRRCGSSERPGAIATVLGRGVRKRKCGP